MKVESESLWGEVSVWLVDRNEPETAVGGWETLLKGSRNAGISQVITSSRSYLRI